MSSYLVAIDVGTTGLKVTICNDEGKIISSAASQDYPVLTPQPIWAETDPNLWWEAAKNTVKTAVEKSGINKEDIAAVVSDSQTDGCTAVDKNGEPLYNSILYLDRRSDYQARQLREIFGNNGKELHDITGLTIDSYHILPKILWLKKEKPEIYKQTHKILNPNDFILLKLTGRFITEYTLASCTLVWNVHKRAWSEKIVSETGIDFDILPEAVPSTEVVGELSSKIAQDMGLKSGTPVVAGGGDEEVAVVGAGALQSGEVCDITGGAEPILISIDESVIDPDEVLEMHNHGDPKRWILESPGMAVGANLRWFRDQFSHEEIKEAERLSEPGKEIDPYWIMDEKAAAVPPGSEGLIFLPWTTGSITPEWSSSARGTFLGFTLGHTRAHFARAIMEGSTYYARDVIERFEELGFPVTKIIATGGGSRSTLWRKIKADTLGKPIVSPVSEDVSTIGAIVLAAVGVKLYKSVEDAVQKFVKLKEEVLQPDEKNLKTYTKLYKTYKKTYWALNDIFKEISQFQMGK